MGEGSAYTGTPIGGAPLLAIAIGASAGGPAAIEAVLAELPWNFPAPIAVCQHMTAGATGPWAARLDKTCHIRVFEAKHGERFAPRRAYIAPIGKHMRIRGTVDDPHISLEPDHHDSQFVPSIDQLMVSIAKLYGSRGLGVVLTGMGTDGAKGLLAIRKAGGVTLAQPLESAFMASMPSAAAELGAVGEFVSIQQMPGLIIKRTSGKV